MEKEEIIEGNKLIAEFMGYKKYDGHNDYFKHGDYAIPEKSYYVYSRQEEENVETDAYSLNTLKFHSSWDWLMDVWLKILGMGDRQIDLKLDRVEFGKKSVFLNVFLWKENGWIDQHFYHAMTPLSSGELESSSLKECLYKTIVDFIKWYNEYKS